MSDPWEAVKHFKQSEFDSPDLPGSGKNMNLEFVKVLDRIREQCGFSFQITSGYRTPEHNAKVSKVERSEHTTGNAADIAISNGHSRMIVIKVALANGVGRIGIAKGFIHLGFSYELPQNVIWTY